MKKILLFLLGCVLLVCPGKAHSTSWISAGLGGKFNTLHQTIDSTTTDVKFNYWEAPSVYLSTEKLASLFGKKVAFGLNGSIGQAMFSEDADLALVDDKMLLVDLSAEAKTALFSPKNIFLLLGVQYSTLPSLSRPTTAAGRFAYEKISTISGSLGVGTSISIAKSFLRPYLRFAYPFSCGGSCSRGGGYSASLQADYGINVKQNSTWLIQGTGTHAKLNFDRLDALTNQTLTHNIDILSLTLRGIYIRRF